MLHEIKIMYLKLNAFVKTVDTRSLTPFTSPVLNLKHTAQSVKSTPVCKRWSIIYILIKNWD